MDGVVTLLTMLVFSIHVFKNMCKEKFRIITQGGNILWVMTVNKNRIKKKATEEVKIKQQRKGE